jgi:hypothetical protein
MKKKLLLLTIGFTFLTQITYAYSIASSLGTNVCYGQTTTLTLLGSLGNVITGSSITWYKAAPNDANECAFDGPTIGTGTYFNVTVTGTITIWCKPYCGTSNTSLISITLTAKPSPGIPLININGSTNLCQGNTVQLTSSPANSYLWSNGAKTQSITVNQAGSYSVTANTNGCELTSSITSVTVKPIPQSPTASNSGITCVGNSLSLSASTITGATYNWAGPNGFTSTQQNPVVSDNATIQMGGTYTVTATVNGCSNTPATTNVIINQATVNSNTTACEGSTLSLTASNISGATYFWTGPNGYSSTVQNPTVSTNSNMNMAGVYSVYTTANGCTSPVPGTIDIVIKPKPSTPIPNNNGPVCVGNNLSLSVPTIVGATYQWTGPNGFSSTAQNPTISTAASATMGGIYGVTVTIDGCSSNVGSTTVQINK